jgi:hypothetical protein
MSDTIYAHPGAVAFSELDGAPTGLVGTIGYRIIRKSDNVEVVARTTAGIIESPAESGRYQATFTAPTAKGEYTVFWDLGTVSPETTTADDLVVTNNLAEVIEGEPGRILTLEEYKARRKKTEASVEADEALEAALLSAEDAVLQYTGRDFTTAQAVETREFPWELHTTVLETDDFVGKPSSITFEVPGIGSAAPFPTNVYWLGPREGPTYYYIDFTPAANLSSPSVGVMGFTRNLDTYFGQGGGIDAVTVKVTAEFGWPGGAPASVKQAVTWLVDEFCKSEGTQGDVQAEAIANLSYVYQRISEENTLPARVTTLLDPYRRLAL